MLVKTDLENRIRQRIQTIYNNDFNAFISLAINAKIDEIISNLLNQNIETIVLNTLLEMPEVQERLKSATKIR